MQSAISLHCNWPTEIAQTAKVNYKNAKQQSVAIQNVSFAAVQKATVYLLTRDAVWMLHPHNSNTYWGTHLSKVSLTQNRLQSEFRARKFPSGVRHWDYGRSCLLLIPSLSVKES
jgi:hypothetical protein